VDALARANSIDPRGVLLTGVVLVVPVCKRPLAVSLERAVAVPGVSRASTGVVVVDLGVNRVVYALNAETPLEPASTEKLSTAITALQRLGGAFRTRTDVFGQGGLVGSAWRGDLVLKGYGDPTLSTAGLSALAREVRKRGIRAISGRVIGDESFFDDRRGCSGWKPSFAKFQSPLLSALVVDRGVLDGTAVDRPALAAARLFTRALVQAGVSVEKSPTVGRGDSTRVLLARRTSPPLSELLAVMDTWSDNFIAEMLLKQLGAHLARRGSTAAGARVVAATLTADHVPLAGVRLADGSGLSRLDRQTARSLAAMLQTVWHEHALRPLLGTFAVAGTTGTLRHRLLDAPNHQLVRGKTGTTDDASALAGFVAARYAFVVLNNGTPVDLQAAHLLQDQVATTLLDAAE
jgi:D-alanyl-D-alanine carboxypeptidase/D-alanyl-D-alanine-endopeptidase (penicillin-binding protein 4)